MHLLACRGGEQRERGLAGSKLREHFYQNEENKNNTHHKMLHILNVLTKNFVITLLENSNTVATTVSEDILESKKAAEDEHEKAGQLIRTVLSSADITRNNKVFLRCFLG